MRTEVVKETRPYRLIRDDGGRYAVIEARCGQVYCLDCDHPRHMAPDTPEGMAAVMGHTWMDQAHASLLFRRMVDDEEQYSQMLW